MEIESKYLVRFMPDLTKAVKKLEIEQGYLNRRPTLRIRKSNDSYILTYKGAPAPQEDSDTVICNNEIEAPLTEEAYAHLRAKIDGNPVTKTRYVIPLGTFTEGADEPYELFAELDIFRGRLEGLVYVEVEFPTVEAAKCFVPPEWFGEDVSMDKRYRNGYLSQLDSLSDF